MTMDDNPPRADYLTLMFLGPTLERLGQAARNSKYYVAKDGKLVFDPGGSYIFDCQKVLKSPTGTTLLEALGLTWKEPENG
jgi:hypothetical protein